MLMQIHADLRQAEMAANTTWTRVTEGADQAASLALQTVQEDVASLALAVAACCTPPPAAEAGSAGPDEAWGGPVSPTPRHLQPRVDQLRWEQHMREDMPPAPDEDLDSLDELLGEEDGAGDESEAALEAVDARKGLSEEERMRGTALFQSLDQNGDGGVDATELVALVEDDKEVMLARLDRNRDKVSLEEWLAYLEEKAKILRPFVRVHVASK